MAKVFVSHASDGLNQASEVYRWLVEAGHEVFLDQDRRNGIPAGEAWRQRLHERLRWADAVVCVITPAYLTSRWCAAEVEIARSRGSRLLPLHTEPGLVDSSLDSVQHIDLAMDPAAARDALIDALRLVDATGGWGWPDGRSPFPGLDSFRTDQHRVFFGRSEEQKELAELLRSMTDRAEGAVLLVMGPSGCGKSSLVKAGLLPVMADEPGWWPLEPIKPGTNPVAGLIRELTAAAGRLGLDWTEKYVTHRLDSDGLAELAGLLLLAAPVGSQRRLLIVIDQFEELLTQTTREQCAQFATLLRPALAGPMQLVATLRSEFLDQLLVKPELSGLLTHTYTLKPLPRAALRAVIEGPARLAAIAVDEHLVARLVTDTDSGEALPLLAYTLAQLSDGVRCGERLSEERYDRLGGVKGALTREADAALDEAVRVNGRSREHVIAGLLRLVTVDEQARPVRWRTRRDELPGPVVAELDVFVKRRLLTTDTDSGTVMMAVAHEAFLSAWRPLAEASAAAVSALRARRAIEHAATEWDKEGRPPSRLWGHGQLATAVADTGARIRKTNSPQLVTDRVDLSHKARDFLHASIRRDRYRRRRSVASVLLVVVLTGAGVAFAQQQKAQNEQRIATARQLVAQANVARVTNPRVALQLGIAAHRIHPSGEIYASLVDTLNSTQYAGTLTGQTGAISSVIFASEGATLATSDYSGRIILWDLTDPARPRQLGPPFGYDSGIQAGSMAFSADGRTLATSGFHGVVVWDLTDPAQPRRIYESSGNNTFSVRAGSMAFSRDGRILATGDDLGNVIFRDLIDPSRSREVGRLRPSDDRSYSATSMVFSPDLHTVAISSNFNGSLILWDLTDPAAPRQLGSLIGDDHSYRSQSMAFSADGRILAAVGGGDNVIFWDLTDRARPRRLEQPPGGRIEGGGLAFSPDLHTVATHGDKAPILWDLTAPVTPRRLGQPLVGHTDTVSSMAFSPDGRTLATGSADGTVILWDLAGTNRLPGRAVERACSVTGGGLDEAGWARYVPGLPYEDTCPG